MTAEKVKRKLTAIFSADVRGYSRLMGDDEEATVRTITAYREVMINLIAGQAGRVVDAKGDNVLAEFSSVVDAVRCAVEVQKNFAKRNAELPEHRKMAFRIGVNLGDVIEEGETIYGDGVNIAARLEGLAEGGGICISGTAFDHIGKRLSVGYEYLGEQAVKNIEKPVRVYRVLMGSEHAGKVFGEAEPKRAARSHVTVTAVVAGIVILGALALWHFHLRRPPIAPATKDKMALPLPDKPSIAVLPFVNMSGNPEQEYFSDGITEDIITNLSKLARIFVVSQNSSFLYKGKQVRIEEVAGDLGVRHVLEGSVRRADGRVRITAQLIDGKTGENLWADKYDRELKDIFSVQDEVTRKVVSELAVALTATESERLARKHTENFEAYDLYLQSKRARHVNRKETHLKAIEMSQRVIDLDPNFAGGYQNLSHLLSKGIRFGWSGSPAEDLEKAFQLAQKAISVDEKFPGSYVSLSSVYLMQGKREDALVAANKASAIVPGDSETMLWVGSCLHWVGRGEEAIEVIKKARELNPRYLYGGNPTYLDYMGLACFTAGRYEESISNIMRSMEMHGSAASRDPFLIASYSVLGRMEDAKESARQLLKAIPSFTLSSWEFGRLYKRSEDRERLYEALRNAGLK